MKRLFVAILLAAAIPARCQQRDTTKGARIDFPGGTVHDFGRVPEGPDLVCEFIFRNTGKSPLVISRTITSDPHYADWPKEPVLPGKTGTIRVHMPTRYRQGPFRKDVLVLSNAVNGAPAYGGEGTSWQLAIRGQVEAGTDAPGAPATTH